MSYADVGGVKLYYHEAGVGEAVLFVHEFAGDALSWEPQLRYFSRRYRAIAYNARGYPPSDVPADGAAYSQAQAVADMAALLDHLGIERAHVVGLSMGSFNAVHFGLDHPERALSLVVAGSGYGATDIDRAQFHAEVEAFAARIETEGMATVGVEYGAGPARLAFRRKDPRGYEEFIQRLCAHATVGMAATLRGVQRRRPSFQDLEERLAALAVPMLVVAGDEDGPSLEGSLYLKRVVPSAGLCVLPRTGHTINLEEPALFNQLVQDFLDHVAAGTWTRGESRSDGRLL